MKLQPKIVKNSEGPSSSQRSSNLVYLLSSCSEKIVLLPTAMIQIAVKGRKVVLVRLLFDTGSQVTFISDRLVHRLKIPVRELSNSTIVTGIGEGRVETTHQFKFALKSRLNDLH